MKRLSREKWEADVGEELRDHLERQTGANIAAGMTPEEARRQAVLKLGAIEGVKQECREQRRGFWLETLAADLRYGLRMLRKNPGFTAVAILTLALGIGANTAIFSVLDAVILKPLPYAQADRLVLIWAEMKSAGQTRAPLSGPDLLDLGRRSRLFQEFGGIWVGNAALTGTGEPEQIKLGFVTANFLSVLGVPPASGRLFLPDDDVVGAARTVILSDALWRRRFGANPQIVGQTVTLDGRQATVVGVMPETFRLIFPGDASVPSDVQAWTPFGGDWLSQPRDLNYIRVVGRLRSGATISQARKEVSSIAAQLRAEYVEDSKQGEDFEVLPLQKDTIREIRPAVLALFAGVGLVLLIACANVANLLLSRAGLRRREMALRSAIGATRGRIVRQLLTESLLLSVLGGLAGLALGWWSMHWLLALRPKSLAVMESAGFNLTVLAYAFGVSLFAGILFGLAPATESSRTDVSETLKSGGKGLVGGQSRFRALLVTCEVALGFVLLIGSGLLIRTFQRLLIVDPGFRTDHVLTFQIAPPAVRYPTDEARARFFTQLQKSVAALPGVKSVGAVSHMPFDDYPNWWSYYWKEGTAPQEQTAVTADRRVITPGYFATLGVPIVAGRDFDETDDMTRPRVIIVDELLAKQTWPHDDSLGKKLMVEVIEKGDFHPALAEVVGVVKHIRVMQLTEDGRPQAYGQYAQSSREQLGFVVRVAGEPGAMLGPIRGQLDKLDKDIPMAKVRVMDDYLRQARAASRFTMMLAAALATLALVLAAIGIYGVTAYSVSQRRNEIGIRMALGAQRRDILKLVLNQGMSSVLVGLAAGLAISLFLTPALGSLLFGVRPTDLVTYAAVALFFSLVGLLACYLPARRAMRLDPLTALRYE